MSELTLAEIDRRFEELTERVVSYRPVADLDLLRRAFAFAADVHRQQLRQSGEPYIIHPLEASFILADIEADEEALAACLLHDTVEDCAQDEERQTKALRRELEALDVSRKKGQAEKLRSQIRGHEAFIEKLKEDVSHQLREEFGETIAGLVDGVTRVSAVRLSAESSVPCAAVDTDDDDDAARLRLQAENLRRMVVAAAKDVRVLIIKLADRLHNMQTLFAKRREKQLKIARETEVLYAKLADRLGIWRIKWEMEDLAFRYLNPEAFFALERRVARTREERLAEIDGVVSRIQEQLDRAGIAAEVYGRPKHLYSIWCKMKRQGIDFDDVYDLEAIRVITQSVGACYQTLGIVHALWKHQTEQFTDYLSHPKSNGYRSIHTKVIVPGHGPMEVQIRTAEMHRQAESGVAAHWRYKEDGAVDETFAERLTVMRRLFEAARGGDADDDEGNSDFLRELEANLVDEEVFVFTPKGEVINLPQGATVVDFAYRIHTEVGHTCIGGKVNKRIVPLSYRLRSGDQCEIIRQRNTGPSRDWLQFVQTATARNRIRQYHRRKDRESLIEKGQKLLEEEAARQRIGLHELYRRDRELPPQHRRRGTDQPVEDLLMRVARRRSFTNEEELLTALGDGRLSVQSVLNLMVQDLDEAAEAAGLRRPEEVGFGEPDGESSSRAAVSFRGVENLMYRRSKCCLPIPGDAIGGYITRGNGIAIHRDDCSNFRHLRTKEPQRCVELDWEQTESMLYDVPLELVAFDRIGLLRDLTGLTAELGINILGAHTNSEARLRVSGGNHLATVKLKLELIDRRQLDELIRRVPDLGVLKLSIRGQIYLDADKGHLSKPAPRGNQVRAKP